MEQHHKGASYPTQLVIFWSNCRIISRYVMEKFPHGMISSTLYALSEKRNLLEIPLDKLVAEIKRPIKIEEFYVTLMSPTN